MKIKKMIKDEQGVTSIIAAVALVVLLAFTALVVDLGLGYVESSELQNAADAAAYAAAPHLPLDTTDVAGRTELEATVASYIIKNGYDINAVGSIELGDVVAGKYTSVRVTAENLVEYNFAPVLGIDSQMVNKNAKMQIQTVMRSTDMVPLGTTETEYHSAVAANNAQSIIIKYDSDGGTIGFFGAIDLDGVQGGGAADFESWLEYGYSGYINVGDVLPTESGNMAGPTIDGFTSRFESCTHFPTQGGCTIDHYVPNCPRVITLILYEMEGTKAVQVHGFVPFILEGLNGNGEITASHIDIQFHDMDSEELDEDTIEFGYFTPVLVE